MASLFYPAPAFAQDPSSPDAVSVVDDYTSAPLPVTDPAAVASDGTPIPVPLDPVPVDTTTAAPIIDAPADISAAPVVDDFPPQPISVSPSEETLPIPQADITPMPAVSANAPAMPAQPLAPSTSAPFDAPAQQGVSTGGYMGDTGARQQHSGTYYDANSLVPDSDLARAGATGPRKVDPKIEPGQKFVTVTKGESATSFEGQYVAATRALKLGRYAAAMEMFEQLHDRNPRDARVLMGLAVAQQGAGFTESASQTYESLLNVQPNNADAIVNLMGIMKAQYPSVTLQRLMELRNKYPMNAGVPAQIGLINAEMKNYGDALRFLEVAATMQPTNSSHLYNMAIVADHQGDTRSAIKYYERSLELDSAYGDAANSLPRDEIFDRLSVLRRKV